MPRRVRVGERLPAVQLARAKGPDLEIVDLERRLTGKRVIIVGLPGAFTPVCTGQHLPALIGMSDQLTRSGIDEIICVANNSPWVMQIWAEKMDPEGRVTFLSDGNLELARAAGLVTRAPDFFLGECSARYTMILQHAVIEKIAVEEQIEQFACTRPDAFIRA
jgi:peroxiredoxin